jgi:hypothetical protein
MDPVVVAFGTALIEAVVSDAWQQARQAVTGLWRRARPEQATAIGSELDLLRDEVLQARSDNDTDAERALEGAWQVRLQQLLRRNPGLVVELQQVLADVLAPALSAEGQARVQAIATGKATATGCGTAITGAQTTGTGPAHAERTGDVTAEGQDSVVVSGVQQTRPRP